MGDPCPGQGRRVGTIGGMYMLVCLKLNEQGVQCSEVVHGTRGVQIEYGWEGDAEEQKVCCSPC